MHPLDHDNGSKRTNSLEVTMFQLTPKGRDRTKLANLQTRDATGGSSSLGLMLAQLEAVIVRVLAPHCL